MSSPFPSPMMLLLIVLAITLLAVVASGVVRRRRQRMMIELARSWRMQYSPRDVFNLAPRIAARLPVAGAADVHVHDLIYGTESGGHRCIFSVEYTAGILRSKTRRRCVVSLLEARGHSDAAVWSSLSTAEPILPLLEQYRSLHDPAQTTNAER